MVMAMQYSSLYGLFVIERGHHHSYPETVPISGKVTRLNKWIPKTKNKKCNIHYAEEHVINVKLFSIHILGVQSSLLNILYTLLVFHIGSYLRKRTHTHVCKHIMPTKGSFHCMTLL